MPSSACTWSSLFFPQHTETTRGHGRTEVRKIWADDRIDHGEYIKFPHASQVFRIERTVERRRRDGTTVRSHEVSFGVTSLTRREADPAKLLQLRRGHWSIENKVHWRRDVVFGEDNSQVRSGHAPRAMASLRNLAMNVLHFAGASNIAAGLRHCAQNIASVARLLGIRAT